MPEATVETLGEEGLIELFGFEGGARGQRLLVPNGDDAAVWSFDQRHANIITTDHQIEGVHFDLKYTAARDVGRKLMAVNLSDVAAMGGRPRYVLLGVSFPSATGVATAQGIAQGIRELCKLYGVTVIGGNTTTIDGPISLSATVIGRAEPGEIVRRRGTQVGDLIFVTGHLGHARLGLAVAREYGQIDESSPWHALYRALVQPTPRVGAGRRLGQLKLAHAMCDVSDGLGRDLRRLLMPEHLGARLEGHAFPMSDVGRMYCSGKGLSWQMEVMKGGEDYELLFTAAPEDEAEVLQACGEAATPIARIGVVTETLDIEAIMEDGSVVAAPTGFEHYGASK